MWVLSRRIGEKIIIGDGDIAMMVLAFDKGQVKLGFDADKNIKINREEIYLKIENEKNDPSNDDKKKQPPTLKR